MELLSTSTYDIAVLDRDIPGPSGDEIAERIVASGTGMPILRLTAAGAPTTGHPGERSPACGWIRSAARSTATAD